MAGSRNLATAFVLTTLLLLTWFATLALAEAPDAVCNVPGDRGTIQAAVDDVNCSEIHVAAGAYDENVVISRTLSIVGQGPDRTVVNGGGNGPVFTIRLSRDQAPFYSLTVNLADVAIVSGTVGVANTPGWYTVSTVTVTHSFIGGNSGYGIRNVPDFGYATAAMHVADSLISRNGGGVLTQRNRFASAEMTITATTISGNTASDGAGLHAAGDTTIVNSTISGNTATDEGGGILACYGVDLTNVTISGNSAPSGGGVYIFGDDAFPYGCHGQISAVNSLIADSVSGGDCTLALDGRFLDNGHNLVEDSTCISEPTSFSGDPMLGPLQDNGGPTPTQALLAGSLAIDAADDAACPTTDQRYFPRPRDGDGDEIPACDIGAYEFGAIGPEIYLPLIQVH
jgi:hypothetical protein